MVLTVGIGSFGEQRQYHREVAHQRGPVQRSLALLVGHIDIGPALYKQAYYVSEAVACGPMQRSLAVFIRDVWRCAIVQQNTHNFEVAIVNSLVKRCFIVFIPTIDIEDLFDFSVPSSLITNSLAQQS